MREGTAIADTNAKKFAKAFWTKFNEYAFATRNSYSNRFHEAIPPTYAVYRLWHGVSGIHTNLCYDTRKRICMVRFCMIGNPRTVENSNKLFDSIVPFRKQIDSQYGKPLFWNRKDDQESSWIQDEFPFDPDDSKSWDEAFRWYMHSAVRVDEIIASKFQ